MKDPLVDRDCVLLDGKCMCLIPYEDCKYIGSERHGTEQEPTSSKKEDKEVQQETDER